MMYKQSHAHIMRTMPQQEIILAWDAHFTGWQQGESCTTGGEGCWNIEKQSGNKFDLARMLAKWGRSQELCL